MSVKICRYCEQEFKPSRYHPDQDVCSSRQCQRRRCTDYHRQKLKEDPLYREQCRDSQRKWRERNPDYMKRYLSNRQKQEVPNSSAPDFADELERLLGLIKNNLAFDLRPSTTAIWLVSPSTAGHEKKTFAEAKFLVLQGTLYALFEDGPKRTSL